MGIVQGLTEFLPVSSSGHLMIARDLLGVDAEGFLDFTLAVHLGTVVSTIVVFWSVILQIIRGLVKFRYNDETDYFFKLCVSMIPVGVVGLFFKDKIELLFGDSLTWVGVGLLVTAGLLLFSQVYTQKRFSSEAPKERRSGISYLQAFIVGIGQAVAVAPGLSRSGTTIATGLVAGVKKENVAQFSFLMVLAPILGEQLLSCLKVFKSGGATMEGVGALALVLGFLAAFASGYLACKSMVALVRRAKLSWFSLYCAVVAVLIFIFA